MTWVRIFARKIFGPYLPYVEPNKAEKWMGIVRILYFFGATSLVYVAYQDWTKFAEKREMDSIKDGIPILKDISSGHANMRKKGVDEGLILSYTKEKGWTTVKYNREDYLNYLEEDAYRRAQEAKKLYDGQTE